MISPSSFNNSPHVSSASSTRRSGSVASLDESQSTLIRNTINTTFQPRIEGGNLVQNNLINFLQNLSIATSGDGDLQTKVISIKDKFLKVEDSLNGKNPIDLPTVSTILPDLLTGVKDIFELLTQLNPQPDDDTSRAFNKIFQLASKCLENFSNNNDRMSNHALNKKEPDGSHYFIPSNQPYQKGTHTLNDILIFYDIQDELFRLYSDPQQRPSAPFFTGSMGVGDELIPPPVPQRSYFQELVHNNFDINSHTLDTFSRLKASLTELLMPDNVNQNDLELKNNQFLNRDLVALILEIQQQSISELTSAEKANMKRNLIAIKQQLKNQNTSLYQHLDVLLTNLESN